MFIFSSGDFVVDKYDSRDFLLILSYVNQITFNEYEYECYVSINENQTIITNSRDYIEQFYKRI